MLHLAPMSSRNQLGQFLRDRGLLGIAVEIGTHRGEFAEQFMKSWDGQELTCIDPWSVPEGYEEQAKHLWGGQSREQDYLEAMRRLQPFNHPTKRVRLCRGTSAQGLSLYDDNTLDFVYIDGDHSLEGVMFDIQYWWTRLKSGGVMAGHDFLCPGEMNGGWGQYIQPAVLSHAALFDIDVYLIAEEGGLPWSYYFIKP